MNITTQSLGHRQWSHIGSLFICGHKCECGSNVVGIQISGPFDPRCEYERWLEMPDPGMMLYCFAFGCGGRCGKKIRWITWLTRDRACAEDAKRFDTPSDRW